MSIDELVVSFGIVSEDNKFVTADMGSYYGFNLWRPREKSSLSRITLIPAGPYDGPTRYTVLIKSEASGLARNALDDDSIIMYDPTVTSKADYDSMGSWKQPYYLWELWFLGTNFKGYPIFAINFFLASSKWGYNLFITDDHDDLFSTNNNVRDPTNGHAQFYLVPEQCSTLQIDGGRWPNLGARLSALCKSGCLNKNLPTPPGYCAGAYQNYCYNTATINTTPCQSWVMDPTNAPRGTPHWPPLWSDQVMTQYCNSHPKDANCACLDSPLTQAGTGAAVCFDAHCIDTPAYKTAAMISVINNHACPNLCQQIIKIVEEGKVSKVTIDGNKFNMACGQPLPTPPSPPAPTPPAPTPPAPIPTPAHPHPHPPPSPGISPEEYKIGLYVAIGLGGLLVLYILSRIFRHFRNRRSNTTDSVPGS
jgi:hypothetical protein